MSKAKKKIEIKTTGTVHLGKILNNLGMKKPKSKPKPKPDNNNMGDHAANMG